MLDANSFLKKERDRSLASRQYPCSINARTNAWISASCRTRNAAEAEARDRINFSYRIADPVDHEILIPTDRSEDFAYFTIGQPRELRAYYDAYGYVVIRGLVSAEACGCALQCRGKPYRGFIYRLTEKSQIKLSL